MPCICSYASKDVRIAIKKWAGLNERHYNKVRLSVAIAGSTFSHYVLYVTADYKLFVSALDGHAALKCHARI